MGARGGKATAGNGGSRKNHHDNGAKLKRTVTAVRGRLGILKVSLRKVAPRPKGKPAGQSRRA